MCVFARTQASKGLRLDDDFRVCGLWRTIGRFQPEPDAGFDSVFGG